jgi:hypothetical protein
MLRACSFELLPIAVLMALMTRSQRCCSVLLGDWAQKEKLLSQSLANAILLISRNEHENQFIFPKLATTALGILVIIQTVYPLQTLPNWSV